MDVSENEPQSISQILEETKPAKRPVGRPRKQKFFCETCNKMVGHDTANHATRGGKRANAGRKPGSYSQKTLVQMKVKKAFDQRLLRHVDKLLNAQMQLAVGEQSLFVKITEGEGKSQRIYHEVVTDPETIIQYLDHMEGTDGVESPNDDTHYYYLSTKPANNMALDSLLNRALGKAPERIEIAGGFFSQNELTIKVVGSHHDVLEIGEDGQIVGAEDSSEEAEAGVNTIDTPNPSDTAS